METILIQLDTDQLASTFDRVVAVDAGVNHLFSYSAITPENVTPLIHGAMFTRSPQDLKSTAIFIGGSNVQAGEVLLKTIRKTFFGPIRVSVMLDSNGSNTTAAAAVLRLQEQLPLPGTKVTILAGTGPVGYRVAEILAANGCDVFLTSRQLSRAQAACDALRQLYPAASLTPLEFPQAETPCNNVFADTQAIIACGAASIQFLTQREWETLSELKVLIDINAIPPVGLGGIAPQDKAKSYGNIVGYGALGVGSLKMKIHKAAIKHLFTTNDLVLNTMDIYSLGLNLDK
jgi:hypothetical protein